MTQCRQCGGDKWHGPHFVTFNDITSGKFTYGSAHRWPYSEVGVPHTEALQYQCGICGYLQFAPTVANGGTPVPTPQPKTDTGGIVMNDD